MQDDELQLEFNFGKPFWPCRWSLISYSFSDTPVEIYRGSTLAGGSTATVFPDPVGTVDIRNPQGPRVLDKWVLGLIPSDEDEPEESFNLHKYLWELSNEDPEEGL